MSVLGYSRSRRSQVGLRARAMALALVSARYPQPSRMIRMSGLGRVIGAAYSSWLLASSLNGDQGTGWRWNFRVPGYGKEWYLLFCNYGGPPFPGLLES